MRPQSANLPKTVGLTANQTTNTSMKTMNLQIKPATSSPRQHNRCGTTQLTDDYNYNQLTMTRQPSEKKADSNDEEQTPDDWPTPRLSTAGEQQLRSKANAEQAIRHIG